MRDVDGKLIARDSTNDGEINDGFCKVHDESKSPSIEPVVFGNGDESPSVEPTVPSKTGKSSSIEPVAVCNLAFDCVTTGIEGVKEVTHNVLTLEFPR